MAGMATTPGPLAGLEVIELAHTMAGPVCGLLLADLGADVVKVERPPQGDPSRHYVPPAVAGESAAFMMLNRNKRGVVVDLKHDAGREIVRRLIGGADVLIENHRAGTLERHGLGYDALRAENPRLILAEVSGFGRTGPYRDRGGFDLIAQGMSGILSLTGEGPGRPPVKCGVPLTDVTAGLLAALGVLAACLERQHSGEGQRIDTSLFEAGLLQTFWQAAITLATGEAPAPMGSAHPLSAPYQAFATADGWLTVGAANASTWEKLAAAVGLPELVADPRFATNAGRVAHRDELARLLAPRFSARSTAHWLDRLERAGVPAGPVLDVGEALRDPQARARQMVVEVEHSSAGRMETLGVPLKLSRTPGSVRRGAPRLGEHTREVLRELGYPAGRIEELERSGVVCSTKQD